MISLDGYPYLIYPTASIRVHSVQEGTVTLSVPVHSRHEFVIPEYRIPFRVEAGMGFVATASIRRDSAAITDDDLSLIHLYDFQPPLF